MNAIIGMFDNGQGLFHSFCMKYEWKGEEKWLKNVIRCQGWHMQTSPPVFSLKTGSIHANTPVIKDELWMTMFAWFKISR